MAQSQLALYNMALSIVGEDYTLSTTSEESVPAETCELWYENVRQTVLRAGWWNSAKQFVRLTEVTDREEDATEEWETTDPAPGYAYSYDYDAITDLLYARYLTSFAQFELHYDAGNSKMVLSTNDGADTAAERPILCYTIDVTTVTRWEPDLYEAMAFALASRICIPLTGKIVRTRETAQAANDIIMQARAANLNEMHRRWEQLPDQLLRRGYNFSVQAPYIYPFGSLITATGAAIV